MMKRFLTFLLLVLLPVASHAATCGGCTIATVGAYTTYTFTYISYTPSITLTGGDSTSVRVQEVAGGGGGAGGASVSGGGGAGGVTGAAMTLSIGVPYPVTVGAGGNAAAQGGLTAFNGLTATGGGAGGSGNGGSGGGGNYNGAGGTGIAGQGFAGGAGNNTNPAGGGGGGAGGVGEAGVTSKGGRGGVGVFFDAVFGINDMVAMGGGGAGYQPNSTFPGGLFDYGRYWWGAIGAYIANSTGTSGNAYGCGGGGGTFSGGAGFPGRNGVLVIAIPNGAVTWTPTAVPTATSVGTPTNTWTPTPVSSPTVPPSQGLAQKPQMGWLSFVPYGVGTTDATIRTVASYMTTTAMLADGYKMIEFPYWQASARNYYTNRLDSNANFPQIPNLVDTLHGMGFQYIAYVSVTWTTCGGYTGTPDQYSYMDMATVAANGADAVDSDMCYTPALTQTAATSYTLMADAISVAATKYNRPIQLFVSAYGIVNEVAWAPAIANNWRTTQDITSSWGGSYGIANCFYSGMAVNSLSGPGHWAFPGQLTAGWPSPGTTSDQDRAQFWAWSAGPWPLFAQNQAPTDATTLATLTNTEAIAVDQDWGGDSLHYVSLPASGQKVAARYASTAGEYYVLLWNDNGSPNTITVTWTSLTQSAGATATVRDIGNHASMGGYTGSYSQSVSATGAVLLGIQFPVPTPTVTPTSMPTPVGYNYNQSSRRRRFFP